VLATQRNYSDPAEPFMPRSLDLNPKKKPVQARAKATYVAIVQSGARILEREGYAALSTNRIAEVAGIAVASLYEYFPSKEAVVAAVVSQTIDEIVDEIEGALVQALTLGREQGLSAWISAMFSAVEKRQKLAAVLVRDVPYLYEVPAVRSLRRKLLGIATRAQPLSVKVPSRHVESVTYLVMLMVSSAVVESVTRPPQGLRRADIELALIAVLRPFLLGL